MQIIPHRWLAMRPTCNPTALYLNQCARLLFSWYSRGRSAWSFAPSVPIKRFIGYRPSGTLRSLNIKLVMLPTQSRDPAKEKSGIAAIENVRKKARSLLCCSACGFRAVIDCSPLLLSLCACRAPFPSSPRPPVAD